jgi:hypothetical protein
MALERSSPFLKGQATIRSPLFSRTWTVQQGGEVLATAHRAVWRRTSKVQLLDGSTWEISPAGWGILEVRSGDDSLGVAERTNLFGRKWSIDSNRFGYVLSARSMLLRKWTIDLGDHPVGRLKGGALSFNRIDVDAGSGIPLEVIMLSWHIIVRAWEAAAAAGAGGS